MGCINMVADFLENFRSSIDYTMNSTRDARESKGVYDGPHTGIAK